MNIFEGATEPDDEFEDDDSCPICGKECWNDDDGGHLLGVFDQDWRENIYGIGGGELYGLIEIEEFFQRVFEETADSLCRGEDPKQAEFSWLGKHRNSLMSLIGLLSSTSAPRAEILSSEEIYGCSYGAILHHAENLADALHEVLAELIDDTQTTEIKAANVAFDSMPGHSYNSGYWWCSHARESAQALRQLLRELIDTPSS
jgi:hypothetical protein